MAEQGSTYTTRADRPGMLRKIIWRRETGPRRRRTRRSGALPDPSACVPTVYIYRELPRSAEFCRYSGDHSGRQ